MKKKFIMLLALFVLVPGVVWAEDNYVNYYNVKMTKAEYDNLVELGFSEFEIYNMKEEEFNANKNLEGKLESENVNYYVNITRYDVTGKIVSNNDMQITEEEYESENISMTIADGYVETVYKKMTTTIAKASSKYRYKVTLTWKTLPAVRSYDIIGIGFDPDVYVNSSLSFKQTYCAANVCKTSTAINSKIINQNGAGVSFKLNGTASLSKLESSLYFDVSKNVSSTIKSMLAYGDYAHATKTINAGAAQGFVINQGGVSLASSIEDYYDTMSSAVATWYGSW